MIAVAGEVLMDLIVDQAGSVDARPGGGPFNVARTIARLGLESAFLGRLSRDSFGLLLRERLERDGVSALMPGPVDAPTTLAVVGIDPAGVAGYSFYLPGTSAWELDYPLAAAALPPGLSALHAGSLGLVMEPMAASIERLIENDLPPETLVMIDPNCRPEAISDPDGYRHRISRILRRADVIKASTEDLDFLSPGVPVEAAAARLLAHGLRVVLVTDGPRAARAFMPHDQISVSVPLTRVVDTIGAGDAFGGAFLAWWEGNRLPKRDLSRRDAVHGGLRAAAEAASLACTRAGAEPPWAAELAGRPGWEWLNGCRQ